MAAYRLTWISDSLAVGHAPMSHEELDFIRSQGIRAIINLCAEFCDLHEIEGAQGFEVYYLPVCDDEAPCMTDLEPALDWLDEAMYLGKKVLVHCRQGIGRTGTFVTAYLLRKGFSYKEARRRVESTRAGFTSFPQWRLLKKYEKNSGRLSIREPLLETKRSVDLMPFLMDYEQLLDHVSEAFSRAASADGTLLRCGLESEECCFRFVELQLVEAAYLNGAMNRSLKRDERQTAIERAIVVAREVKDLQSAIPSRRDDFQQTVAEFGDLYARKQIRCPLNVASRCIVYGARPVACRVYGLAASLAGEIKVLGSNREDARLINPQLDLEEIQVILQRISKNMFHALTSTFPVGELPIFTLASTVSGRFVQEYFEWIAATG